MRIDRIQKTVRPTYSQHYGDNSIIPHKQDDTRQQHTPTNQCLQYSLPERSTVHCAQGAQHQDSTGRRRGQVIILAYRRCYDTPFKWTLQMVNEDAHVYKVKELCQNGHIICQFRHKSLASVRKHITMQFTACHMTSNQSE